MNYFGRQPIYLQFTPETFVGTGAQTSFTLARQYGNADNIDVLVNGVEQKPEAFYLTGNTLVFTEAPSLPISGEAYNIVVKPKSQAGSLLSANWNIPIADTSGTDTYTATFSPAITSLVDNLVVTVVVPIANANTITTPTLNINGLGAKTILNQKGDAVVIGAIKGTVLLRYESSTQNWWVMNDLVESGFIGSNQLLATNGYQKFPGGLILQWGYTNITGTTPLAVNFPIPFPNACLNGSATDGGTATGAPAITISSTQIIISQTYAGTSAFWWFAIGY